MSEEIKVTQDTTLDVASIFNEAKKTKTNTTKPDPTIVPAKTPLQLMQENRGKGLVIQNNQDDGPKRGGSMTEERVEAVQKTMSDMDELAEKARLVGITQKPSNVNHFYDYRQQFFYVFLFRPSQRYTGLSLFYIFHNF